MKHEERKEKAIELLKELDIYKPYIKGFVERNQVCFFERFGGYWVDQEPEVEKKMKEIETEYDCTVYAITHEYTEFGECYSFMYVSKSVMFNDASACCRSASHGKRRHDICT